MDCLGIELYLQKNYITVVLDDSDDCVYVDAGETYFRQNCCFSIPVLEKVVIDGSINQY